MKKLFLILLCYSAISHAWESDNYTLSPIQLADTGSEVSEYISNKIEQALIDLESEKIAIRKEIDYQELSLKRFEIRSAKRIKRAMRTSGRKGEIISFNNALKKRKKKISKLIAKYESFYSELGVARYLGAAIGGPIAKQEKLDAIFGMTTNLTPYENGLKESLPTYYYPGRLESIYSYAGFHRILHPSYFILSSTIKLYDIEMGMDKLGHFFNQGLDYYQIYMTSLFEGRSIEDARLKAVSEGVSAESSYFGLLVSGIYSNADLAANYSGLYFYTNLFAKIELNDKQYGPILIKNDLGNYVLNNDDNESKDILKRFITPHFNEAYNSSKFEYLQKIVIEKAMESRCQKWVNTVGVKLFLKMKENIEIWNYENYGHSSENNIDLEDICFSASK